MNRSLLLVALLLATGSATGGVDVQPIVTKTIVVLTVTKTGSQAESVLGVHFDHALAECTAPDSDASPTPVSVDMNTKKTLGQSTWTVTCIRKSQTVGSDVVYPALDLVLVSTAGPSTHSVPADAKVPYQFASEILRRMNNIAAMTFTGVGVAYPHTPGACPNGYRDSGWVAQNTYPGGPHGQGTSTRVCISIP